MPGCASSRRRSSSAARTTPPLQLDPGDTVLAVERVRTADDQPVIYSLDRIPARLLRTDLDLQNLDPSLFALLSSSGHAADHATATLRAVASTSQTAKVLGVRRGKPLLYIEEIDFDRDGTPVMLSREWHVSEAFDVRINRKANSAAARSLRRRRRSPRSSNWVLLV